VNTVQSEEREDIPALDGMEMPSDCQLCRCNKIADYHDNRYIGQKLGIQNRKGTARLGYCIPRAGEALGQRYRSRVSMQEGGYPTTDLSCHK